MGAAPSHEFPSLPAIQRHGLVQDVLCGAASSSPEKQKYHGDKDMPKEAASPVKKRRVGYYDNECDDHYRNIRCPEDDLRAIRTRWSILNRDFDALFSSYGSPSKVPVREPSGSSPLRFTAQRRASVRPFSDSDPTVSLYYSDQGPQCPIGHDYQRTSPSDTPPQELCLYTSLANVRDAASDMTTSGLLPPTLLPRNGLLDGPAAIHNAPFVLLGPLPPIQTLDDGDAVGEIYELALLRPWLLIGNQPSLLVETERIATRQTGDRVSLLNDDGTIPEDF